MRNLIFLLFILFISTLSAGEIKKEFDVSPGGLLEADIKTGGSIHVTGWDKNKVEVTATHRGDRLDEDINLDIDKMKNGVTINAYASGNVHTNLHFEVMVPKVYDIDLNTMGGEITVSNIEGDLEGETMGGEIELSQLKGKVRFSTMGGNVELKDSDVDGKVSTMGGEVLFENVVGDVDGSSMGGNVIYKNVKSRNGKSTGKEVNISTMGGEINVDEAMSGADVSTMGGNIKVRKAADHVKATTMGGNITIDQINGWVKASTMGGDIDVNMTGDPAKGNRDVNISSMGGDIELTLPDGISARFDVRITYTRRSSRDYQIKSDFPLDIKKDKEWEYDNGEPKKEINGSGKTGDGKNLIKVTTHNGDIIIRKGKN